MGTNNWLMLIKAGVGGTEKHQRQDTFSNAGEQRARAQGVLRPCGDLSTVEIDLSERNPEVTICNSYADVYSGMHGHIPSHVPTDTRETENKTLAVHAQIVQRFTEEGRQGCTPPTSPHRMLSMPKSSLRKSLLNHPVTVWL